MLKLGSDNKILIDFRGNLTAEEFGQVYYDLGFNEVGMSGLKEIIPGYVYKTEKERHEAQTAMAMYGHIDKSLDETIEHDLFKIYIKYIVPRIYSGMYPDRPLTDEEIDSLIGEYMSLSSDIYDIIYDSLTSKYGHE
jgi:hypothetical protein